MTTEVKLAVRAAGPRAAGVPVRVSLDVPTGAVAPPAAKAIYLAYNDVEELQYIGKVDRADHRAVQRRLGEHRASAASRRWRWLWVVPLAADTPTRDLLALERGLIRHFRPPGNSQHVRAQ
jgi:hypothetical protein